jgi:hypothetical protein
MIPKTIHYCWFSGESYPQLIKDCLHSWEEILSGYSIKKWDTTNTKFDIPFAQRAFKEKKWAFLTDYIRMKILFEEGGIFLDTDVLMIKPFDDLLTYQSFWNFADNGMVEPVVIGAQKGNLLVRQCMKVYENIDEKELASYTFVEIPKVITPIFIGAGFKPNNQTQIIESDIVLNNIAFCSLPFIEADKRHPFSYTTSNSYAIHLWNANWIDDEFRFFWNKRWNKGWYLVRKRLIKNPFQPIKYFKDILYHFLRQMNIIKQ